MPTKLLTAQENIGGSAGLLEQVWASQGALLTCASCAEAATPAAHSFDGHLTGYERPLVLPNVLEKSERTRPNVRWRTEIATIQALVLCDFKAKKRS